MIHFSLNESFYTLSNNKIHKFDRNENGSFHSKWNNQTQIFNKFYENESFYSHLRSCNPNITLHFSFLLTKNSMT